MKNINDYIDGTDEKFIYFDVTSILTIRTKKKYKKGLNDYFFNHLIKTFNDSNISKTLPVEITLKIKRPITKGNINFKLNSYTSLDSWDKIEYYLDNNIDYNPKMWETKTYIAVYSGWHQMGTTNLHPTSGKKRFCFTDDYSFLHQSEIPILWLSSMKNKEEGWDGLTIDDIKIDK
jgi:hypothetical protein